jgi:hypothetical protein
VRYKNSGKFQKSLKSVVVVVLSPTVPSFDPPGGTLRRVYSDFGGAFSRRRSVQLVHEAMEVKSLHSCQYNQALNAAAVRTKGVLDPILDPSLAENALR